MSRVVNITTLQQLDDETQFAFTSVLLYGATSWCAPCRALKPKYAEASDLLPEAKFLYVDLDDENTTQELLDLWQVQGVPFMVKYVVGNVVPERIDTRTLRSAKDIVESLS